MWILISILLVCLVTCLVLFTNNPLIRKIHGKPFTLNKKKIKKVLLGNKATSGVLYLVCVYSLLIIVSFIFLYPLLFMILTSLKPVTDLADSSSGWLPSSLDFSNYVNAVKELGYFDALWKTIVVSFIPSLLNVLIASFTAYGFAKFRFPLKKFWFGVMIATFIIPKALTSIPQYAWYSKIKLLGTLWTYLLPASFGQGIYFALYFLILYSTFKQIPVQLEESARIDGASNLQIFFKVVLPLVIPSLITVFLFSFVWYWNDASMASMYLNVIKKGSGVQSPFWTTIPVVLQNYQNKINAATQGGPLTVLYQGIKMAGTLLSIIPLLVLYFALQRYFVEGIEKSGITGE